MFVKPKKHLGQHFLADENIAAKIAGCLKSNINVLEIGPGTGVLTKYLIALSENLKLVEIDIESVEYLKSNYPQLIGDIFHQDFLKANLSDFFDADFSIIGNFPYNISSQIFFKITENRSKIPEVVCMIQKEVAERLSSPPGNKTYGILSVILGAYYNIEYLFTVGEKVFVPPPKVKSAVIRLIRKENFVLGCDEKLFTEIIKTSFNQRRKTLRNSLKQFWWGKIEPENFTIFTKRPEQLSVQQFIELTEILSV
jgi:16S rRNA (adenine1518-N6/adenine1519-N6)-dimethyltransferase